MPKPPRPAGEWDAIVKEFDLGPDHKMLVQLGEQAWGRWREIVARIDKDGLTVDGGYKGTPKAHPLLESEVRARAAVVSIVNALKLPEPEGDSHD